MGRGLQPSEYILLQPLDAASSSSRWSFILAGSRWFPLGSTSTRDWREPRPP